jgi:Mg2+ and Co2+ transporter CorA
MELPPVDTFEGAYWYIMSVLIGLALLSLAYFVAADAGLVPDLARLY